MKDNLPLITVVTVVFNAENHIEKTIQSVINQTYPNVEYIIIDGGSTDGTLEVIKKYENNINQLISEPDKGIFDAMNKGIDLACGKWINFMNAGDCFYSDDVLDKIFSNKDIKEDYIYGDAVFNFRIGVRSFSKEIHAPDLNDDLWKKFPCHQSSFVKTDILKNNKFNIENEQINEGADLAKLLECYYVKKLKFKKENIIVSNYLGGGYSSSNLFENSNFSAIKKRLYRWRLISNYVKDYKVHIHYSIAIIRAFLVLIILKCIPDDLKFIIFKKFYK